MPIIITRIIYFIFITFSLCGCGRSNEKETSTLSSIHKRQSEEKKNIHTVVDTIKTVNEKSLNDTTDWNNKSNWELDDEKMISPEIVSYVNNTSKTVNLDNVLRFEGEVFRRWSGVESCCVQDIVNSYAQRAIDEWVHEKMIENRDHQFYNVGFIGPIKDAWCRKTKNLTTGKR